MSLIIYTAPDSTTDTTSGCTTDSGSCTKSGTTSTDIMGTTGAEAGIIHAHVYQCSYFLVL